MDGSSVLEHSRPYLAQPYRTLKEVFLGWFSPEFFIMNFGFRTMVCADFIPKIITIFRSRLPLTNYLLPSPLQSDTHSKWTKNIVRGCVIQTRYIMSSNIIARNVKKTIWLPITTTLGQGQVRIFYIESNRPYGSVTFIFVEEAVTYTHMKPVYIEF